MMVSGCGRNGRTDNSDTGNMYRFLTILTAAVFFTAGCASNRPAATAAERMQAERVVRSGVLEAKPGFTGDEIGVEVERVEAVDGGRLQALDMNLPLAIERVDRIEVESVSGEVVELPREPEIDPGPDPRNTGIRIYLPKRKNWEFRIKIIDVPEDQ